ncbi:MAG: Xaa-Pro aminopeptidase [Gammaproteobacteria bacterium]|nr:Xaa-Pro aminopeptidase [Gammaproteobacteria bacterium]
MTANAFKLRRQALAEHLPPHSVAIIPAAKELLRNGDAHYRFRQHSDFYYLTGFQEPDAVLILSAAPQSQSILFTRPRRPSEEQWTGKRLGPEEASTVLGVDLAYSLEDLDAQLPEVFLDKKSIVYAIGQEHLWDERLIKALHQAQSQLRSGVTAPDAMLDLVPMMGELRLKKTALEIELMREAARITVTAHQRAMRACRHLQYEYELEAELLYEFFRHGSRAPAYDSIVASGNNACTLHYTANDGPLTQGELVLVDAGAEFRSYAADVTRTYPVNGTFSAEQRLIYDLVLTAQKAGIAAVRPGEPWDLAQRVIVEIITQGLKDLNILKGDVQDLIAQQAYKPFYAHNSGHWLGLDVHDVGRYRLDEAWRALEPGMVLTVEPGIYISEGMEGVDPRWWGIGVRIEDDILVTAEGHDNLTAALVSEAVEIEAFIRG